MYSHTLPKCKNVIDEPVPEPFKGEYKNLLSSLMSNTWIGMTYVIISIIFLYSLGYISNPLYLFIAIEIPIIIACGYVISPNPNISFRLPINWSGTAVLAALISLIQVEHDILTKQFIGNILGAIIWFFVLYWLIIAITWNIKAWEKSRAKLKQKEIFNFIAPFLAIWGATLQIAYIGGWVFLPFLSRVSHDALTTDLLIRSINTVKNYSILKFFPFAILLLGILLMTSLHFKDDPYEPKELNEVLPNPNKNQFINSFMIALRIPVWIVIIILGFISHFVKLAWESLRDFSESYLARIACILLGLILGPLLLFTGHELSLLALNKLAFYLTTKPSAFNGIVIFFYVNFLMISALCFYVIAAPLLLIRYRGGKTKLVIKFLQIEIFKHGKDAASSIGQTFSLFGIVAFAVPVSSSLPGGPNFGTFSILYSSIIIAILIIYFHKNERT